MFAEVREGHLHLARCVSRGLREPKREEAGDWGGGRVGPLLCGLPLGFSVE